MSPQSRPYDLGKFPENTKLKAESWCNSSVHCLNCIRYSRNLVAAISGAKYQLFAILVERSQDCGEILELIRL